MSEQAQGAGARVNTGGPAYPYVIVTKSDGATGAPIQHEVSVGMSLRDHFAGLALSGWPVTDHGTDANALARKCYEMADAMIATRGH